MIKISTLTFLAVLFVGIAQGQRPVQVNGTLDKKNINPVKLFKVVKGDMQQIASAVPQQNNRFGFTFYPEYEGFYALGTGEIASQTDNMVFYFKEGDQLDIVIKEFDYELLGKKNSKENQILSKWHKVINPIEDKSFSWKYIVSNFVDFFPELEGIYQKSVDFSSRHKSGNKKFDQLLPDFIKWDLAANATNYLITPRTVHPAIEEYVDYYHTLTMASFSNQASIVYNMPWGNRTLAGVTFAARTIERIPYERGLSGLSIDLNRISNDTLRADAFLNYLARQKDYTDYKAASDKYKSLLITPAQKLQAATLMNNMAQLEPGDQGLNFSFPDIEGKVVSFNDLKGKVVLIDVWATWCAPCKAEIPSLQKLEKDMHDTDLQVVSISLDEVKDKDKWVKMVQEENLGGLQLFASGWGDFADYYKIRGIPRFMVFDREGKVVTVDSPRPSNPALKQLLEKVLMRK